MTLRSLVTLIPIAGLLTLAACTSASTTDEEGREVQISIDSDVKPACSGGYTVTYNPCQYSAYGPIMRCNSYGCYCSWY